jgi:hypothetical protein
LVVGQRTPQKGRVGGFFRQHMPVGSQDSGLLVAQTTLLNPLGHDLSVTQCEP